MSSVFLCIAKTNCTLAVANIFSFYLMDAYGTEGSHGLFINTFVIVVLEFVDIFKYPLLDLRQVEKKEYDQQNTIK